jgi:hypothetical protein
MELAILFIDLLSKGDIWFGSTSLFTAGEVTCGVAAFDAAEAHFFP